jgi:hypothetical protein
MQEEEHPCGGGVEYLYRDPTSRRRRRKEKSQIWDSKIWSRVLRDSDPRKTSLARPSCIYKRQTRPFVREGARQKQCRNCETVINIWSWAPEEPRHQDLLTDWPSVTMWLLTRRSTWTGAAVRRRLEHGSRGIAVVGAVTRKRLVTLRTLVCVL